MKPKRRYPGVVGYLEDKMEELRELCDSRDEEWVRNERQRREDASRKRHEENVARMAKWFTEEDGYSDIDPETGEPWIWLKHKTVEQEEKDNG